MFHCSKICQKSGQHNDLDIFKSDGGRKMGSCGEPPSLDSANTVAEFCQDSASVPRGFSLSLEPTSGELSCNITGPAVTDSKDTLDSVCNDTELRM